MFMDEVEQTTAFWLWSKYASKYRQENDGLEYYFQTFLISVFHSSLLSVRKLNDFFTDGKSRSGDIKASRYGFKYMTSPLDSSAQKKLNKYLAHMTIEGENLRLQGWAVHDYARPIYLRSFEFCQHLESNFLDPKMDKEILTKVASIRRGLSSHIKRVGTANTETKAINVCPSKPNN